MLLQATPKEFRHEMSKRISISAHRNKKLETPGLME